MTMLKFEDIALPLGVTAAPAFVPTSLAREEVPDSKLRRVTVDDKSVINSKADVNQLVPFKYKWAWEKYLAACANHWMPQSTLDERKAVERQLVRFCQPECNEVFRGRSLVLQ